MVGGRVTNAEIIAHWRAHRKRKAAGDNVVDIKGWVIDEMLDAVTECLACGMTWDDIEFLFNTMVMFDDLDDEAQSEAVLDAWRERTGV